MPRTDSSRLRSWLLGCSACALLAACATASTPPPSSPAPASAAGGEPAARPSLAALPELTRGGSADTPRVHQGLLIARAALDATMPEPPDDRSYAALQRWVDSAVVAWVEQRRAQTAETRDRFRLEGEPSASEVALSHAVVGLLHEDTAVSLRGIPAPSELESEPEIAAMYRDIVAAQADTFVNSALLEFRDCANSAYNGAADMRPFAEFCHARFEQLQAQRGPARNLASAPAQ